MKTIISRWKRIRGSGLVIVMVVTFSIAGILTTVVASSLQRCFMARRLTDRIRAQAIAEAGVSRAYEDLSENFDLRLDDDAFPAMDYLGGSFDVTVLPVDADVAVINSQGKHGDVAVTVILDVRQSGGTVVEAGGSAYGFAIIADGEISWTGCGVFQGDSYVHANQLFKQAGSGELNANISSSLKITLNGKSGEIDGDATAPTVAGKTSKVTGTVTESAVSTVEIPEIDLLPYYNEALANGQVYEGSQTLSSSFSPPGGIMWVNGDLHISGPHDVVGCFIATGDIHCSGSGGQAKVDGYPGFVSRDGDIKFSGSGDYNGLVYTRIGDVQITGSGSVSGSIICGGDFKKAGCSTIINYIESIPSPPHADSTDGVLCVSAWQR